MAQVIHLSPIGYEDVDLAWMTGRVVTDVSWTDPLPWRFSFGPEASLAVECLWRVVEQGRVKFTSEDHGHQFGLPAPLDAVGRSIEALSGRSVTSVHLREFTADLLIEFTGGVRLEVIPKSAGYEAWELRSPAGALFIATGGGDVCTRRPRDPRRYVQEAHEMLDAKINAIRAACSPLIGSRIEHYETAEVLLDDGSWHGWPDLPLRLFCSDNKLLSISWSGFDDLWVSNDLSLPFAAEDATTRWKKNGVQQIDAIVGRAIHAVILGRGQMTVESRDIEIWTRLVFDLGDPWLEVFNALDQNGYDLHAVKPQGEFRTCT